MDAKLSTIPAEKIVVVMPNWLGDAVMATPFLRALRGLYPGSHIAALARPLVAPVLAGLPFVDATHVAKRGEERAVVRWLRGERFDLGILLPNSFRSAWLLWRGKVKRRLGYARDRRSFLLTHRALPAMRSAEQRAADEKRSDAIRSISREIGEPANNRVGSRYQPVPTIDYYLQLAKYVKGGERVSPGIAIPGLDEKRMELAVTAQEQTEADAALALAGISAEDLIVTVVPGANFGSSKCWPPERFAQLADRLMDRIGKGGDFGAHVVLASSPAELPIVESILAASLLCPKGGGIGRLHALAKMNDGKGVSIGALKQIVRRSRLMVCNDTGPRHFAAAFGVPVVTLFGPTDPVWAETFSANERIVRIDVPCSPCQLKKCPIDHRCMKGIGVEMVLEAARGLWEGAAPEQDVDPRLEEAG